MNTTDRTLSSVGTTDRSLAQSVREYLCSLKLAMLLLLSLAITSIIGTIIPQGNLAPEYIQSIGQTKLRLYQSLGFFDMYHSWWFVLLLGGLTINLIACSFKRLPHIWKLVTQPATVMDEGLKRSLPNLETIRGAGPARELAGKVAGILGEAFSTPRMAEKDGAIHLYAQKAPWCRLAVYVVHLSIIVIFAGAIVGSLFGFKGYVSIPEGGIVTAAEGRGAKGIDLGFAVRCEKFSASFYDTGAPREFKSILTVLENDKPVPGYDRVPVIVNDPLTYKGITFYQSSYGKTGEHAFRVSGPGGGNPVTVKVSAQEAVRLPDGSEMHVLESTMDVSPFEAGKSGPAANIEVHTPNGQSFSRVVYGNYPDLNRQAALKTGGPVFDYLGGRESMFTGLQVSRDPGVWIVWLGCLLMVVGVYCAFFMSHRRIWVVIGNGEVVIGGNANKNPAGFSLAFDRLVERIKGEVAPGGEK